MTTRNRIALTLLSITAVWSFSACSKQPASPASPTVVTGLKTAQAQTQQLAATVSATGTVRAIESSTLSSQVTSRIRSITVREGDSVRAGQTLVILDDAQLRADTERTKASVSGVENELRMAQSDAALAASTLNRYQLLRERKSVSPQEFDEVERRSQAANARVESLRAQVAAAKASVSSSHTMLGYTRIQAPFDGVVTARHADPGTLASPGVPLLEVEKSGRLQLAVTVDESLLRNLQKGMSVEVEIAALSTPQLSAQVAQIIPAADPASHSFLVKIDLPSAPGLHPGMFGTAEVKTGEQAAVLVPQAAIVTHGSLNGVWALDSNHIASLRYITLGAKHGDMVEVLSGISAGESIVAAAGDRELSGKQVEVGQ